MSSRTVTTTVLLGALFGWVLLVPAPSIAADPTFIRGDADGTGDLDLTDAVFLLLWQFMGSQPPSCMDAADANDTGSMDISDAIYVLNYLYLGGPEPPAPGPEVCGVDETPDELNCIYFQPCVPDTDGTQALMVLVEYQSIDGLIHFTFECQQRGVEPAVLAKSGFVTEHCAIFRTLQKHGLEIIGWCGPELRGMDYASQRELVLQTQESIEACMELPLKGISTRLFATDATTCRVAEELGIPYVLSRGTTGTRATVYKPTDCDVRVISVSAIETGTWADGTLSDWSVWARGGTAADLQAEIEDALRHDKITPVSHTLLGGVKQSWNDVLLGLLDDPRVQFHGLDDFAAEPDVTLPLAKLPWSGSNPYGEFDELTRIPVNIQVTESRENAEALEQVVAALEARGIGKTTIFVKKDMAEVDCALLRELSGRGHEVAAFVRHENEQGEKVLLEDMTRAEQESVIGVTHQGLADCLGHPPTGFRSTRFSQNEDTNEILGSLGFDWHASFVRGRNYLPGHESSFSPYRSLEYGFYVVTMIGAQVGDDERPNALCDTSLEGSVEGPGEWSDIVKGYFHQHQEDGLPFLTEFHPYFLVENPEWWDVFLDLAEWLGAQDAEFLTTTGLIERWSNQFAPNPSPAIPYEEEPNLTTLHGLDDFPFVPGSGTVGNKIVYFHNGVGPMCIDFLDYLATIEYATEEHLTGEADFWDELTVLKQEFGSSEGVSTSFGYFPIIFVKDRAFSGFNDSICGEIAALIAP